MAKKKEPKKEWKVKCWQEVTRYLTVTVQARDEREACRLARDKTNDHSGPWEDEEVEDDGTESAEEVK